MRGSLLISYEDTDGIGGDFLTITKNGVIMENIYEQSNNLFSIPLIVGDVVTLTITDLPPVFVNYYTVVRNDYTTDDINGNNGIIQTTILDDIEETSYTFTATTINTAYNFEYVFSNSSQSQFQIWTEASEPIMTQNDEYLNQQY